MREGGGAAAPGLLPRPLPTAPCKSFSLRSFYDGNSTLRSFVILNAGGGPTCNKITGGLCYVMITYYVVIDMNQLVVLAVAN